MSDQELIDCARQALKGYGQVTELPYFLLDHSDELEPFLLVLRAVSEQAGSKS